MTIRTSIKKAGINRPITYLLSPQMKWFNHLTHPRSNFF
jgi:hypothetical protein